MPAREAFCAVELVLYIPAALTSLFICSKHGFGRSSGFLFTLILCLVRIIGAICELISYRSPSAGLIKALIVIDTIGLSPLLLATLGMLSRFVESLNAHGRTSAFTKKHFRIIQLLVTLSLVLSIAGGSGGSAGANGSVQIATTTKFGVALYIVAFVALTAICLVSSTQVSGVPAKEGRIPLAVVVALPFIAVRLVYSILTVAFHNHLFNPINGELLVYIAMAFVEEYVVVVVYLLLGFVLDKLSDTERGPLAPSAWENDNGRGGRGRGRRGRGQDVDEEHHGEGMSLGGGYTGR